MKQVTSSQINRLSIDDVPEWFRPKITLGMARRDQTVVALRKKLEETFFIMAFNKQAMCTADLEAARAMFPNSVTCRSLKNSFVKRAMAGTEWEAMTPILKGSLMYVFVMEDTDLKESVKAYIKLEKEFGRVAKVASLYEKQAASLTFQLKPLVGGMLRDEWNIIEPEDIPKLKDFPTKTELIGRIAGGIQQVTKKIAVGVKQVPQKLAVGTKKITEKMEEDGKDTVGDVTA